MRIVLIVLGVMIALVVIVVGVGYTLPVKHKAARQARYNQSPSAIFAAITDVERFPSWRESVKSVEVLPDSAGKKRFREKGSDGAILYEVVNAAANRQLVTRIADPSLPFGGTWTYDIVPDGASSILSITEDGEVYNPVFRFVSRFVMGHTRTIDRFLTDLAKKFGESSRFVIQPG
jgi:uncharacterized protein YndB with AHSA1/START domain